jgi:hypothetical protein
MKLKCTLLLLIIVISKSITGQSIPTYWMNIYDMHNYYEVNSKDVSKLTVSILGFYAYGGRYDEKWIYDFYDTNKIQGEKYFDNELKLKFVYEFDSLRHIIKKINEIKIPLVGWQKEIYTYEYTDDKKTLEKHFDGNNNLIRIVKFEYDFKNNLNKISIYNSNMQLDSYETAVYKYEDYYYNNLIYNSKGEMVLNQKNYCIDDTTNNLRDKYGSFLKLRWPIAKPRKNVYHIFEYKYDLKGNWIYRKEKVATKWRKRRNSIITREIQYRETK